MKLIIMESTVSGATAATTLKNFIDSRKFSQFPQISQKLLETYYLDNDVK